MSAGAALVTNYAQVVERLQQAIYTIIRHGELLVNHDEARLVRHIFERYLELGSVRRLKMDLEEKRIVSGTKVCRKGNVRGGKPFSRGALYHLLSNPIYVGDIRHEHDRHAGQHEPVISGELWERVQQQLRTRPARHGEGRKTEAADSPLAGKLFDESGELLYVQGAAKGERRYRYYVSKSLVKGGSQEAEQGWRLPAPEIERTISAAVQAMLADRTAIALALEESGVESGRLVAALKSAAAWVARPVERRKPLGAC